MFVSIIIPVYNAQPFLRLCLESILNQEFADFEALLIDDGSTDGSSLICDEYARKDCRFRALHKSNEGVSAARNCGLSEAKGDWICFVDSDDILLENGLQVLVSSVSDEVDMVWGGYEVFNERMECTYAVPDRVITQLTSEKGIELLFRPQYYRYLGFVWGRLFRRSVIESFKICFDNDIYYNEDRLFNTCFLCASKKDLCMMTSPVYGYREHLDSAMGAIERCYSPKFETDLTAMIMMRKTIRRNYPENKYLLGLIDSNSYSSWRRMVGMAGFYEKTDLFIRIRMIKNLVSGIGLKAFVSLDWNRNKNRILKFIKKFS